jgi:hypothetical protein
MRKAFSTRRFSFGDDFQAGDSYGVQMRANDRQEIRVFPFGVQGVGLPGNSVCVVTDYQDSHVVLSGYVIMTV